MVAPVKHSIKLIILFVLVAVDSRLSTVDCFADGRSLPTMDAQIGESAKSRNYIRVAIMDEVSSLRLSVNSNYEIINSKTREVLSKGKYLNTTVILSKGKILVGEGIFKEGDISIEAESYGDIIIDGRKFKGGIRIIKRNSRNALVVNEIDLEDYIKGILYHEASHYWPQEALKAQAVACRTYAVYQMQKNTLKSYDVTSDIYSQVYGGKTSERYRTNRAVEGTRGFVLVYHNKPFCAYFHATCAGHTENASLLWDVDLEPLKGVPCSFCKDSPHFNWHQVLSLDQVKNALIKNGYKGCGDIKSITITGRDNSGRITYVQIETDKKSIKIPAKDFRIFLGADIIRSTNFEVTITGNDAVFVGFGWGHGVGMCQWGAYFMAKQGYDYKQILEYYYPGSKIVIN